MTAAAPVGADDVDLARRARAVTIAQRALFTAQRLAVHHTLFRILGSNREIEDVLQDSFFEIFRSLQSFRGESSLTTWCRTIATRTAYLSISKRRPVAVELALVENVVADGDPDARRNAIARDAARRLYAALDRIEPRQRVAFALVVIDGLSIREAATLTDSSATGVKTRSAHGASSSGARNPRSGSPRLSLVDLDGGAP